MALTESMASSSGGDISHDPILEQVARTNTFDLLETSSSLSSDWPTLRHHLHLALLSVLPIFQSRPPKPYSYSPKTPTRPSNPMLLSPTPSPLSQSKGQPGQSSSTDHDTTTATSTSPSTPSFQDTDEPSTLGGLVIPPFPPLDPNRPKRRVEGGTLVASPIPAGPGLGGPRIAEALRVATAMQAGNVFGDEWDEEIVIGGKKLPGWMEGDEARMEVERVARVLEGLPEPPFTIQRLSELLLDPIKSHTTLGKFLRAIEKNLLVTTPWETPTYTAVPPSSFTGSRALFGPSSSSSSPSMLPADTNSTMPKGSSTPMFSPIPFLVRPGNGSGEGMDIDQEERNGVIGEEPMSPLVLNQVELPEESEPAGMESISASSTATTGRSPTPEPEDPETRSLSGNTSSDPAHQPYLGRVDELDTGPVTSTAGSGSGSNGNPEIRNINGHTSPERSGDGQGGTGEGGNMTPHGMSDKPVPISATTTVKEEEGGRRVAGLPRSKSVLGLNERFVSGGAEEIDGEESKVGVEAEKKE